MQGICPAHAALSLGWSAIQHSVTVPSSYLDMLEGASNGSIGDIYDAGTKAALGNVTLPMPMHVESF